MKVAERVVMKVAQKVEQMVLNWVAAKAEKTAY
jgi:hypothetical protein